MKRFFVVLLAFFPLVTSCGGKNLSTDQSPRVVKEEGSSLLAEEPEDNPSPETEEEQRASSDLFLLTGMDTAEGTVSLRSVATGEERLSHYNGVTSFLDKYGTMISPLSIYPGEAVTVSYLEEDLLSSVRLSDEVFRWEGLRDYDLDLSRMVFTYRDSNYRIDQDVPVYENGTDKGIFSLQEGDTLRVTGLGKDILSITVTTGIGTIALRNIGVFQGGWLKLDNKVYQEISGEMNIPAEEGTHVLTVANNGWGDSTVVAVRRGETVAVDLDALKGAGPKYCDLSVTCDVEGAEIRLDGKVIEADTVSSVQYGLHSLSATSEGFDPWESRLFVNSKEAVIEVKLDPEGTAAEKEKEQAAADETMKGAAGSLAGSLANSKAATEGTVTEGNTVTTRREAEQAAAETMLDTVSGMLDTLTGGTVDENE